jgi:murein L,D-transpeptidase YcbB/YkuD
VALSWLLGYSTALNRTQADTFDVSPLTDPPAILRLVMAVCQQLPDALVDTVAHDLLMALAKARVTTASPIVETRAGNNVANVRRQTLVQMQQALISRGHLGAAADGVFGPQTAAALRTFQEQQGLELTGVADSATIFRLLVELPAQAAQ